MTTKHERLEPGADAEARHLHRVDSARHLGLPMAGAASGAALGACVGALAGPAGAMTGAVLGGIAGAAAGRALDVDESRVSKHDGELDDEAVRSENVRAAPVELPPLDGEPGTRWVPESWPPETASPNGGSMQPTVEIQATQPVLTAPQRARVVRALNGLIETNVDAEKRLGVAAADVRAPKHKGTLHGYAARRAELITALQGVIARMGAAALNEGSTLGAISRGWEALKLGMVAHDDTQILRDCASADALAARRYDAAHNTLLDAEAPAEIVALVDEQRTEIALASAHLARLCGLH